MFYAEDELEGVFYDTAEFAVECTRVRPLAADVVFPGITSTVDEDTFDGHVNTGVMTLRYPSVSVDIVEGDRVVIGAETFRVLNGRRLVEGAESEVHLTSIGAV